MWRSAVAATEVPRRKRRWILRLRLVSGGSGCWPARLVQPVRLSLLLDGGLLLLKLLHAMLEVLTLLGQRRHQRGGELREGRGRCRCSCRRSVARVSSARVVMLELQQLLEARKHGLQQREETRQIHVRAVAMPVGHALGELTASIGVQSSPGHTAQDKSR